MSMTPQEVAEHNRRYPVPGFLSKAGPVGESHSHTARAPDQPAERETGRGGLHEKIQAWLDSQHPKVPCAHNRTDQKSTAGNGVPDFIIPYAGKVLLIECKTKDGKLTKEQLEWHHLAMLRGVGVHIVRSFAEFESLVNSH